MTDTPVEPESEPTDASVEDGGKLAVPAADTEQPGPSRHRIHRIPQRFLRSLAAAAYFGVGQHEPKTEESKTAKRNLAMFDRWPARLQRAYIDVFGINKPGRDVDRERTPLEVSRLQRAGEKRTRRRIRNLGMSIGEQRVHAQHGFTTGDMLAALHGDKPLRTKMIVACFEGWKAEPQPVRVWVDTAASESAA